MKIGIDIDDVLTILKDMIFLKVITSKHICISKKSLNMIKYYVYKSA